MLLQGFCWCFIYFIREVWLFTLHSSLFCVSDDPQQFGVLGVFLIFHFYLRVFGGFIFGQGKTRALLQRQGLIFLYCTGVVWHSKFSIFSYILQ